MLRRSISVMLGGLLVGMASRLPRLALPTIEPMPMTGWPGSHIRSRWPRKARPAGSKLARLAREGRVGITKIH